MGDPFRGDENAALLRAARLEEENERLRKELEEAKRPKPPPERAATPHRILAAGAAGIVLVFVAAVGALVAARHAADRPIVMSAKTLAPSPSTAVTSTSPKRAADWVEEKHVIETNIGAVSHGVKPPVSYAVGGGGTILRRYGEAWTIEESGTTRDLHGVAEILGRVCAVGDGGVATCALDPATPAWKLEKTGTTTDLLALTEHYGFLAVGRNGVIVRRNSDGTWHREDGGTKEDLFGVAGNYIVGARGTILTYENNAWHAVKSPTTANLYAVETHLSDVVIVGAGGVVLRLGDPRAGFQVESSGVTTDLYAVEHGSGFESYAAGAGGVVLVSHGAGGAWTRQTIDTSNDLHAIDCSIPTMFIAGDHGTILSRRY